jgi:hypothetical protein
MTVTREFVVSAFLKYLERPPESEETINHYMAFERESEVSWVLTRSREFFRKKFKNVNFEQSSRYKFLIIGNCQVAVVSKLIEAMSAESSTISIGLESTNLDGIKSGNLDISTYVADCNYVLIQNLPESFISALKERFPEISAKLRFIPAISYTAFHPDMGYIKKSDGGHLGGPTGDYHSLLCYWAWKSGISTSEAIKLFRYDVFEFLGYFSHKASSEKFLINLGRSMDIHIQPLLSKWSAAGCFMHSINHPKLFVLADVARLSLAREGIRFTPNIENYLTDDLSAHPCWDVYPEVAKSLGFSGEYSFKQFKHLGTTSRPVPALTLSEFVEAAYENYDANAAFNPQPLVYSEAFSRLQNFLDDRKEETDLPPSTGLSPAGANPYAKLKSYQLWRRGVEAPKPGDVDPVVSSALQLDPSSKVATAGSCFAQHISRTLSNNGFTYYVAETGEGVTGVKEELEKLNYGVYSARYGNLYTSRQLIQLFDRAYGKFLPIDGAWLRKDGRYVDPFRPMVNPDGYATEADVERDRIEHFKHVRNMFESLDVFVFTLGLTESWRRREDGAVFPLAPGVAAGGMDRSRYEFVNFETHDVVADLEYFLGELARVNPAAKVIFTVSPVPLVATYENRHVLTSTTYSKSALRSAADYIVRRYPQAEYFPSYEIITGNFNKGAYFETDLRSVREEGVSHVMRLFMEHYSSESTPKSSNDKPRDDLDAELLRAAEKNNSVVCEEEALDPGSN